MAGFGATGAAPAVPSSDPLQGVLSWRADRPVQGTTSASVIFEAAASPLVVVLSDPLTGEETRESLLRDLAGLRAGARYSVSDRLELAASFPYWIQATSDTLSSGPAPGDLAIFAPYRFAVGGARSAETRGARFAASVVPAMTLPTGAESRYLGDPGPSLSATVHGEARVGPAIVLGWAGFDQRFFRAVDNVRGGPGALGGLSAGVEVDPRFGVHLGWRFDQRLLPGDLPAGAPAEAPRRVGASEAALSVQGTLFDGWFVSAGLGTLTRPGPGAADLRLWFGAGRTWGVDQVLTTRTTPSWTLVARAPDGLPVAGAELRVDGVVVGTTDVEGRLTLDRPRRSREVEVDALGVAPALVPVAELDAGEVTVELAFDPVRVVARVQDSAGLAVRGQIQAIGPDGPQPAIPLSGSTAELALPPGTWEIAVDAEGYGSQARTLVLAPRGAPTEEVTFLLQSQTGDGALRVRVVDVSGAPVAGATLALGGVPIGTSGSGGDFRVEGLAAVGVVLDAQADTFRDYTRPEVIPAPSGTEVELVLTRERGAVQVVVRGPVGQPVPDAGIRFVGADRLGPFPMGDAGRRTFVLRPGPWQLLVSSARYGSQQRALDIPDRETALQVVEIVLQPPEDGKGELVVRVVDPDNQPVAGVEVKLDGASYGTTSSGGEVVIGELREGPRTLAVTGARHESVEVPVLLTGGVQEKTVVIGWIEGTTLILARGPQGMVQDASARFAGPAPVPVARLGAPGFAFVDLDPGAWQVLVASPRWGAQQHGVAIPAGSRSLHVIDAVLALGESGVGKITFEVTDPEGEPVRGARLTLDGVDLGSTSSSGALALAELATGKRTVEVAAPGLLASRQVVDVGVNDTIAPIRLAWAPGAVRVSVTDRGKPATGATVRLGGPRFVPASPVDGRGRRMFYLEPGTWQVLATAPGRGAVQVRLAVPEDARLTEVNLELSDADASDQVVAKVQDPDGRPIPGAAVQIDELPPTLVGEGGFALIPGISPGTHRLSVQATGFQPLTVAALEVEAGAQDRVLTLAFEPKELEVRVEGPGGSPLAGAQIRLDGPADVAPVITGPDGSVVLKLRPGTWTVGASAEGLAARATQVSLGRGDEARIVRVRLVPGKVALKGGQLLVDDVIHFDVAESTLRPESAPILDEVAALLLATPEIVRVEVGGHTDPIGGVAFNTELSRRRAKAVAEALIARGVAPERLVPHGYGPARPLADNESVEGRAANRRVEFTVAE